jgi:chromosomal replication initiator protein
MNNDLSTAVHNSVETPAAAGAAAVLWNQALEQLRGRVNEHVFRTYFVPIAPLAYANGSLDLALPSNFMRDWVRDHFEDVLSQVVAGVNGGPISLRFEVREPLVAPPAELAASIIAPARVAEPAPVPERPARLNPKYTFDSFVVGPSNQFAVAACVSVAENPGKSYNPLFIWGGVGLGKTHLLHAIANRILAAHPEWTIVYQSSEEFTNDLIQSIQSNSMAEFRARYRDRCDVLLIDDIQFIGGKESTEGEFFHTFNALHGAARQIVLTSDKIPAELHHIEERLRSRFQWGLIADIQPPEVETRVAILKKKAEVDGIQLSDDVGLYLATHVRSNVRELEGALVRLVAFSELFKRPLSVELAKDVLKDLLVTPNARPDAENIIRAVADHFGVKVSEIKGGSRTKTLARARHVAMYLVRNLTNESFPDIGRRFDGKDHSTVLAACDRVKELMQQEPDFRGQVESLQRRLQS